MHRARPAHTNIDSPLHLLSPQTSTHVRAHNLGRPGSIFLLSIDQALGRRMRFRTGAGGGCREHVDSGALRFNRLENRI